MTADKLTLFLSRDQIDQLNQDLAEKITRDYLALDVTPSNFLVIVTLKGAVFFAADLIRKIPISMKIDFVKLSSYGLETKSSGSIALQKDTEIAVKDQHVLILDEIVDSGRTLSFLLDHLAVKMPKSIKVATLLSKPSRREVPVQIDYCGQEVADKFLVGYGLDYAEKYRQLQEIYALESA